MMIVSECLCDGYGYGGMCVCDDCGGMCVRR